MAKILSAYVILIALLLVLPDGAAQAQVVWKKQTRQVKIPAGWVTIHDSSRTKGHRQVERHPRNGLKQVTYRVLYNKGKPTGKSERVSERILRRAIAGRVRIGTKRQQEESKVPAEKRLPYVHIYPFNRDLIEADLKGKNEWQLKLMRNAIFARHGRPFHDAQLARYFGAQSWYRADRNWSAQDDNRRLSAQERRNAEFIVARTKN